MKKYLMIALCFALFGCVGPPEHALSRYEPVIHPDQRILLDEFSFLPPNGENWKGMSPYEIYIEPSQFLNYLQTWGGSSMKEMGFKKRASDQNRASDEAEEWKVIATKYEFFIMDFANEDDLVEMANRAYIHADKMGLVVLESNSSLENFNGMNCVRSNGKLEGGRMRGPKALAIINYKQGLTCVHPIHSNHVISLKVNQAVLKGQTPTNIQNELDPLFKSLTIINKEKKENINE